MLYELTSISVTGIPAGVMTYALADGDGFFNLWLEPSSGTVTIENAIAIDIEGILPPPLSCGTPNQGLRDWGLLVCRVRNTSLSFVIVAGDF
jgi:hypothetical protein